MISDSERKDVAQLGPPEPDPADDPIYDAPGVDPQIDESDEPGLA